MEPTNSHDGLAYSKHIAL